MTLDNDDLIGSIMASLGRISFIRTEDIPNIDLYMDQVTSFIDAHLKNTARNPGEDRILTKTMVNNYAKNDLLPPPQKKKYSQEHMLILIFIYYFKNILSINDIQNVLHPITERYFGKDGELKIAEIYETVVGAQDEQLAKLKDDVLEKYEISQKLFEDRAEGDEEEFLQLFSFICMLSFDVYTKKLMIEKIIDGWTQKQEGKQKQEAPKESGKRRKKNDPSE